MLEFFRKNVFINSLLLLPYTVLIRIKSLVFPELYVISDYDGVSSQFIFSIFGKNPTVHSCIAILLVFLQGVMINRLIIRNRIYKEQSLLAGLFYILFASFFVEFLSLSPALFGMSFVIISLDALFRIYKKPKIDHKIFSAGFWMGLASLFYMPYALFFIVVLLGLLILRSLKTKEIIQALTGFGVPYFLSATYLYWFDKLDRFSTVFKVNFAQNIESPDFSSTGLIYLIIIGLAIAAAVVSYTNITSKKSIQAQKKADIIYWLLFISVFSFLFTEPDHYIDFMMVCVPLSIFVSTIIMDINSKVVVEFIHLFLVVFVVSGHFGFVEYLLNQI